ncbi:Predicted arabinose efflux permease, MFS family [Nonomuraea maritima]|uniref:Predicted arabinose efflux permease, MFS family n=1 Tax=Nonomuraea maritima TaxID=683260 RepID=A0A1G9K1D2_9ACTN|nr:MFS transporter [Nonomuraea maritima]SDL43579.1 Predicted arabinose efflux permease, MFS family [Nonomuraea maritima]
MVKAVSRERRRLGSPPPEGINPADPNPFGWGPFIVLFVVGMVDRIEANLMAGVLPLVQGEWGFSDTAAGSIPTAAALAAAAVALPAGYLADRYSRTRIIAIVVLCWALATLGSGLAAGFAIFYLMRVLLAAAENIDNPAVGSLLADYYPAATRMQVYGWTRMTTYLGGVGTLLGGVIGQAFGWRAAFLLMAIPGALTALLVWRLREPERGVIDRIMARASSENAASEPAQAPEQLVPPQPGPGDTDPAPPPAAVKPPFWPQVREVFTIRTLILVSLGVMILTLGLGGIYYWLPSLLVRTFGMGTGVASTITGTTTIVGVVAGTVAGARIARKLHGRVKGGRLLVGGTGITVGSALLGCALLMNSPVPMVVLVLLAVTISSTAIPTCTASIADVVGARSRGVGFAVLQFLLTIGGAFGPLIVGITSDATGSLIIAMYALIVPMIVGGLVVLASRGYYEREAARVLEQARDL